MPQLTASTARRSMLRLARSSAEMFCAPDAIVVTMGAVACAVAKAIESPTFAVAVQFRRGGTSFRVSAVCRQPTVFPAVEE
jgi:hypothetical protein